jgi:hypothetical protein
MALLLPTPADVTAAFIQKCVVRLTDSLPLSPYNETKLKILLKNYDSLQFFAYHFRQHAHKLVSSAAKSQTESFQQLESILTFALEKARQENSFSVAFELHVLFLLFIPTYYFQCGPS